MRIKNKMKKVFSIIVSAVMMMSMLTVTAFAAPTTATTGTLKIDRTGATFTAYKVLDAVLKEGTTVYEYSATTAFAGFFGNEAYGNYTVEGIKEIKDANAAEAFAAALEKYAKDNKLPGTEFEGGSTAKELAIGYYLVVQTASDATNAYVPNKTVTVAIPETADNETFNYNVVVTPKDSLPTVDKVIVENSNDVKKNDVSIGDTVTYKLTSTVPQYPANTVESSIEYYLKDTLSKGLTFNADSVSISGVKGGIKTPLTKDTDYVVNTSEIVAGTATTITFNFTGKYTTLKNYDSIEVTYTATLNEHAIIGGAGNPNDVLLGYTNNPTSGEKHETEEVEVKTYTYAIGVEKVDATSKATLAGAEFELRNASGNLIGKYGYAADGSVVVSTGADKIATDANGRVYFIGLDEGSYKLKETKAPNGYILLSGTIDFTITATKENGLPTGACTVAVGGENVTATETVTINGAEATLAKITVENKKGFTLPTTGGAGTWMFTIGGLVLMAGAVVVFAINKKRA